MVLLIKDVEKLIELKDGYKIAKLNNATGKYYQRYILLDKDYGCMGPVTDYTGAVSNLHMSRLIDETFGLLEV